MAVMNKLSDGCQPHNPLFIGLSGRKLCWLDVYVKIHASRSPKSQAGAAVKSSVPSPLIGAQNENEILALAGHWQGNSLPKESHRSQFRRKMQSGTQQQAAAGLACLLSLWYVLVSQNNQDHKYDHTTLIKVGTISSGFSLHPFFGQKTPPKNEVFHKHTKFRSCKSNVTQKYFSN